MIEYSQQLHRDLVSGKRRAIGWGLPRDIQYKIIQLGYPVEFMIDGLSDTPKRFDTNVELEIYSPDILNNLNPEEWGIIIFSDLDAHGNAILHQLSSFDQFPYSTPPSPWDGVTPQEAKNLFTQTFKKASKNRYIGNKRSIGLYIHQLIPGGAEKQIYCLALGLNELSYTVTLISNCADSPACVTWTNNLRFKNIRRVFLDSVENGEVYSLIINSEIVRENQALYLLNRTSLTRIIKLERWLQRYMPDTLIAYLDEANIIASISGLLSGVPNILISGRNFEPNHFPSLQGFCVPKQHLQCLYLSIMATNRVVLTNNSQAGAESYSQWLNIPVSSIPVIENAIVSAEPSVFQPDNLEKLGSYPKILLGVMRLSEEKRPQLWLDVAIELCRTQSDWQAILIGDGPLKQALVDHLAESEYESRINIIGEVSEPEKYMRSASALLHTARAEGTPNVILEAQANALPFLCFRVGGIEDIVPVDLRDKCFADYDSNASEICDLIKVVTEQEYETLFLKRKETILRERSVTNLAQKTVDTAWGQHD